jgi:hypothetical protein
LHYRAVAAAAAAAAADRQKKLQIVKDALWGKFRSDRFAHLGSITFSPKQIFFAERAAKIIPWGNPIY